LGTENALLDMSDREGAGGGSTGDDELSLPKATVAKMISGMTVFH